MDLQDLGSECTVCGGEGTVIATPGGMNVKACEACEGTGIVPTESGEALLDFLERRGFESKRFVSGAVEGDDHG